MSQNFVHVKQKSDFFGRDKNFSLKTELDCLNGCFPIAFVVPLLFSVSCSFIECHHTLFASIEIYYLSYRNHFCCLKKSIKA
jgi:hypothetical protein